MMTSILNNSLLKLGHDIQIQVMIFIKRRFQDFARNVKDVFQPSIAIFVRTPFSKETSCCVEKHPQEKIFSCCSKTRASFGHVRRWGVLETSIFKSSCRCFTPLTRSHNSQWRRKVFQPLPWQSSRKRLAASNSGNLTSCLSFFIIVKVVNQQQTSLIKTYDKRNRNCPGRLLPLELLTWY